MSVAISIDLVPHGPADIRDFARLAIQFAAKWDCVVLFFYNGCQFAATAHSTVDGIESEYAVLQLQNFKREV